MSCLKRQELEQFILTAYHTAPDYPWIKYPDYAVFRHESNKKWFALLASVPKNKIGLSGNESIDIVNVKCDPIMIGSLLTSDGFFPAYHMNKTNWITIALDDSVPDDTIKMLLQISFELTS